MVLAVVAYPPPPPLSGLLCLSEADVESLSVEESFVNRGLKSTVSLLLAIAAATLLPRLPC